jgi:serine protease Do
VIGINTIKIAVQGFEGMGFSIPSKQVQMVTQELISKGYVMRPILGIQILGEINEQEASYFNIPLTHGVAVSPLPGGAAAKAGLKEYDIITAIDGIKMETAMQLQEEILNHKVGEKIEIKFARMPAAEGDKMQNMSLKIQLEQEK